MTGIVAPQPLYVLDADVGPIVDLGWLEGRGRRCVSILGGSVTGAHEGRILPGGADWQSVAPDGSLDLEARYILAIAGGTVEVLSRGVRTGPPEVLARMAGGETVGPGEYYFRTALRFQTSVPELKPLNTLLAVGVGERLPTKVRLRVFPVL